MEDFITIENVEKFILDFSELNKKNITDKNYSPSQSRGGDGRWDGGSESSGDWKPTGSKKDIENFTKDSKIKYKLYHGTKTSNVDKIKSEGFKYKTKKKGEDRYGSGIYLSTSKSSADRYSKWVQGGGTNLSVYINVSNPFTNNAKFNQMADEKFKKMGFKNDDLTKFKNFKEYKTAVNETTDQLFKDGYDALIIKPVDKSYDGNFVILRDAKKVMVEE